ncbi:hypothetical protein [Flavobacterium litorale]|uniref:Uncharacterized protein n=1 Tax=Flavobacterium litorale TaxID=2856519 RepID=A0ABX8V971_9FLAO|nr:hypothetical protein [Flavobacterium litorale]QYJ69062.1 hypothetical protein K1I41_04015 [Flavobacterium litorale]
MKKINLILFLMLVLAGCKGETPIDDLPLVKYEIQVSKIAVGMNAIVRKDDIFQIFYTEDGSLNFSGEKTLRVNVKGSKEPQDIVFELPERIKLTNIRIDTGENKAQGEIIIKRFWVNNFDKQFEVKGNSFFSYFTLGPDMKVSMENSSITTIVKDDTVYDPMLYPDPKLTAELKKLLKQEQVDEL